MSSKALIIPAAGSGERMGSRIPKPFIPLNDEGTVLEHTLRCFLPLSGLRQVVVATSVAQFENVNKMLDRCFSDEILCRCVEGGTQRQESVFNALKTVGDAELIIIHDAVRPFIKKRHILACCKEAEKYGAAILAVPVKDTIKKGSSSRFVEETPLRENLWSIQTPQVFKADIIKEAYHKADTQNFNATDDASLVEMAQHPVKIVEGESANIKITYPEDLAYAAYLFKEKRHNV